MAAANVTTDASGRLISADRITTLAPNEIFVFGSNARGQHGGGAARYAMDHFGAVYGQGHGLHGASYAIDTMSGLPVLAQDIDTFLKFAAAHPDLTFLVTEIGCGIAGYHPAQIAHHLAGASENVALPRTFVQAGAPAGVPRKPRVGKIPELSAVQLDRAVGAIVASAAGDALGAPYEFGPTHPDDFTPQFGTGTFGHQAAEWTDDTSMAIPILEAIARGDSLRSTDVLGGSVERWLAWSRGAKDVGSQIRAVLGDAGAEVTEAAMRDAARRVHESSGRSAGNGSLMRTGPVALAYLRDGCERRLVEAAARIAQLTHWEHDNEDAVVLWSLCVRHAILTGELNPLVGMPWVPQARQSRWAAFIALAMVPGSHPRDFHEQNGWVVKAFQGALSAVSGATNVREALHRAIRGGGDTDTVAAIAGSLAGAVWGATQVPLGWQRRLHGWPGYRVNDLARLAVLAARRGHDDEVGWPSAPAVPSTHLRHTAPRRHPHDDGVWLGSQNALGELPPSVSAVVSLCRVGTHEVPDGIESVRVWLVDSPNENLNLDWTLADAADVIASLRAEGKEVFLHCAEARSRTAAVAALYGMRHQGIDHDQAWLDIAAALPYFNPAGFHRDAVRRIVSTQ